jgi:choline monooxygenase
VTSRLARGRAALRRSSACRRARRSATSSAPTDARLIRNRHAHVAPVQDGVPARQNNQPITLDGSLPCPKITAPPPRRRARPDRPRARPAERPLHRPRHHRRRNRACLETTWAAIGVGADVPEPGDAKPLELPGPAAPDAARRRGRGARLLQHLPPSRHDPRRCPPQDRGRDPLPLPFLVLRQGRPPRGHAPCGRPGPERPSRHRPQDAGPDRGAQPCLARRGLREPLGRRRPLRGDARRSHRPLGGVRPADAPWRPDSSFTLEVATNWKLAVENYCESYHLPWVHPGLNSYSRLEDHYHIEAPGRYSGQGTLCLPPAARRGRAGLPRFREPFRKWDEGAEYVALYPNVLLGVHRDHAFAIVLEAGGP